MVWKHKSYTIDVDKNKGTFFCDKLHIFAKPSLQAVNNAIDKILDGQIKKNVTAYEYDGYYHDNPVPVTILSIDKSGIWGNSFWVRNSNGTRSKSHNLYKINKHNNSLFAEIAETKKQREELKSKEEKLEKQLESITPQDIEKETGGEKNESSQ